MLELPSAECGCSQLDMELIAKAVQSVKAINGHHLPDKSFHYTGCSSRCCCYAGGCTSFTLRSDVRSQCSRCLHPVII